MSDSIQVAIKVRPLIKRERDENLQEQWNVVDNVIVPADPEKRRSETFQFDHIFDPKKTNSDVFETVVRPIVDAAVKGFNGTVFAYGQTSSGKTHTMLGTVNEPGVIPLAVERMFDAIAETCGREFLLRVSYLEIYNEKVNDLLETKGVDLKLREDTNGLVQVINCKEEIASNPDLIMSIMKKGDKNRRIGETDMNERSSRSHTIFRITIESREQNEDSDGAIQVSQLNLVDLAGSERARQTNATGERFKEGTHINMSLSALGLVIKQLSEFSDNTKYVNFRDSKLTRLLQASLGGNAMTTIICAVTPAAFEETQCTLWFASRAKSVKNKPQLNEVMSEAALLKRYKKQLAKLNEELEKLKNEKGIPEVQEMESKLQEKEYILQERDRQNQMLEERIELLKNAIVCTGSTIRDDNNTKIPRTKRRRTWAGDRGQGGSRFSLGFKNLPTIAESSCHMSDSKSSSNESLISVQNYNQNRNIQRRKSIIQSVNLNEQSFETAFTDFELELIKVAKEREEQSEGHELISERDVTKSKSRMVKFEDDVEIYRFSNGSCWSVTSTPEKQKVTSNNEKNSPGTPKSILRERLSYLTDEYNALQEFTTLERQILSSQKLDFDSPNEKLCMQTQIDDLLMKLHECNIHQTELREQLTVSIDCIGELSSVTPYISELCKPLINNKESEADTSIELRKVLETVKNFKKEQSDTTKTFTPLEKKLTEDYNGCVKELEQVKLEKEQLFKENTDIKNKLISESNKLQSTLDLVNTLRTDTDCLMEKLIQKNSELAKLKERVVELERITNELDKSSPTNVDEIKKDSDANVSVKSNSTDNLDQNKDAEILRLNETIQEKLNEISKYRQFEEEIKLENEQLQQALDKFLKIDRKTQECQTDSELQDHKECQTELLPDSNLHNNNDTVESKDSQITELSVIIKEKDCEIERFKLDVEENKKEISDLQQRLQSIINSNEISNEQIKSESINAEHIINTDEKQISEIDELNKVLKERILEINNCKESERKLKEEIENLKQQYDTESKNESQTIHVKETVAEDKETDETEMAKEVKSYQEEISTLKQQIEVSTITNEELQTKIETFNKELTDKLEEIEKLTTINTTLQNNIDEKIKEISDLQHSYSNRIQELETNINVISLERDEFKKTVDSISSSTLVQDLEEKIKNLEDMIEKLNSENDSLKRHIDSFKVEDNKTKVNLTEELLNSSEKSNCMEKIANISSSAKSTSVELKEKESVFANIKDEINTKSAEGCEFIKPKNVVKLEVKEIQVVSNTDKIPIKKAELESSSIFANMSYFDNMEVGQSFIQDGTSVFTGINESKDISNLTTNIDVSQKMANQENVAKIEVQTKEIMNDSKNVSQQEITQTFYLDKTDTEFYSFEELKNIKRDLEKENLRLFKDLQNKIQETEEIQKIIIDFKQALPKLQQTIDTLTNENMHLSKQLTDSTESNNQIVNNFQSEIDTLTTQLTKMADENISLKNQLDLVTEHLETLRAASPVVTDDEIKNKLFENQERIKSLTNENISLSTDLMEVIQELEKIKLSKVQEYDHQCTYREKADTLLEKVQCLENENIELSNNLTDQMEECDKLQATVDILKTQLESYTNQPLPENTDKTDFEFLKNDNERLTNELIEMTSKVTQLSRENANLSSIHNFDNYDEPTESANSQNKSLSTTDVETETCTENNDEVKNLQEQVNHLTQLNKKLTELKLTNCNQCSHLKELNDSRRNLKLEVKALNQKLSDLQKKFEKKCIDTEALRAKVNEDFNTSRSFVDSTLNNTTFDEINVTAVEEKISSLYSEVEELKENHNKLANQYQEKSNEFEILQLENNSSEKKERRSKTDSARKSRILSLQKDLDRLSTELHDLKKASANLGSSIQKLMAERVESTEVVESLKLANENLKKECNTAESKALNYEEKIKLLEEELNGLYKQIETASSTQKEIQTEKLEIEVRVESLLKEKSELADSFKDSEEKLKKELEDCKSLACTYEKENADLKIELERLNDAACTYEKENTYLKNELQKLQDVNTASEKENADLKNELQKLEDIMQKLKESNNNYLTEKLQENADLKNELQKLEDIMQKLKESNNNYLTEKLQEEIDAAKCRIIKETKCLANLTEIELKALPKKSVADVFMSFLNAIVSKETELVKRLQDESEKSKQKLEEEKQQCIDAEKRANVWAKTLETDLEKLQADLAEQERKYRNFEDKYRRLEDQWKEAQHEKQQLHSNMANLESHLNTLQNELEKKMKSNVDQDSALTAAQEREKLARTKEEEWEHRLMQEKEEHRRELRAVNDELNMYKSTIDDLKNTVEGLDHELEHLKNTVDIKTNDLVSSKRVITELENEVEHMAEIHQQLKGEILEKEKHIEEITGLLKIKCDLLTEYKTKVETMNPEFESMQAQIAERKICIDKYKEEIRTLKLENKKQLDIIQDKLSDEEIKSSGLAKQNNELKNKNTALCTTIEEFKDRCVELEREITSLQKKVRNSTSKLRVENEIQELQDENRSLKNHLEGSYNRIKELQESKSQVQRELAEAQGKSELLQQEVNTTKIALESVRGKYNNVNLQQLREKYESLLREKSHVVLEVEEKKMLIASKDQKLVEYGIELDTVKKQKEMLNIEIESMTREKSLFEEKIVKLVKDIEQLKEQIDIRKAEAADAYKLIMEEKNKTARDLEICQREMAEIIKRNKELDEEMDDMVTHVHKLENENAELFDKIITGSSSENLDKIKKLEDENEQLQINLRVIEVKRSQLENEIVRLNTEKEQLLGRIEDLNNKYGELESKVSSRSSSKNNSPTSRKGRRRQRRSDMFNMSRNLEGDSDNKEMTDSDSRSGTPIIPPIVAEECQICNELRNRIREMSLDIVSRNNKITMLEVQLQSENFPYQVKYNELQRTTLALKTKNSELKSEIQKLQRALMEDSSRECQICRQKKLNKRDQGVQVKSEDKICLSGMSSGIVEEHLKLIKMEKERNIMKDICRSRAKRIKELEQRLREFEGLKTC